MTDRYNSLTVVLGNDVRSDDAESLIKAICCFRGVINVAGNVADIGTHVAEQRVRLELGAKLREVLFGKD